MPLADDVLAATRGTALPTRALIVTATEQAVAQGQRVSETMRLAIDNWLADSTPQLIANAAAGGR